MNPFEVARLTGNNLATAFGKVREENAIGKILSQVENDPQAMQNAIGQILTQVSPERQGAAIQYLQSQMQGMEQKRQQDQKKIALQQQRVNPYLPESLQKIQYENQFANQRAQDIFGFQPKFGGEPLKPKESNQAVASQNATEQTEPQGFQALTDNQLISISGEKGYAEPAKQELKRRQEERANQLRKEEGKIKRHSDISQKVLEKADTVAETIPQKQSSLDLMKNAISSKDMSFWTRDNLAELTGIEGLRSPEAAIFKTAGKEYFLGNISRAGARPNQWIEQQISDMLPKLGRSTVANLSVVRALENELGIDKERVRLTEQISNDLENQLGYIPRDLGARVSKELSLYAEQKQKELYNDLRAIKSISEKKPISFMKVKEGTPVSQLVVKSLLNQFNNDPKKAADEATKLGYIF